ncbi:MAG: hypothetical protein AVDCRST_MAG33-952, partial [uncultured Thermomicrobiales bacterium]
GSRRNHWHDTLGHPRHGWDRPEVRDRSAGCRGRRTGCRRVADSGVGGCLRDGVRHPPSPRLLRGAGRGPRRRHHLRRDPPPAPPRGRAALPVRRQGGALREAVHGQRPRCRGTDRQRP